MITVKDVAREAGVSISTVSNVLNNVDKVSPDTRARVLAVIERLQFVPNVNARSLKSGKRRVIGLFVSSIQGAYYATLTQAVHMQCKHADYQLNIYVSNDSDESELYAQVASSGVAAAIIMNGTLNDEYVRKLRSSGMPLVFIDRECAGIGMSSVVIGNYAGVTVAMEYLIGLGHRRIGFIHGLQNIDGKERFRAYRDAMKKHGLQIDKDVVLMNCQFERSVAYAAVHRRLRRGMNPPDAFFCANDEMAWGCISALREHGIRVPEDVSVMGFDDTEMSAFCTPPLSTLHSPIADIGTHSAQEALKFAADPEAPGVSLRLEPMLILRKSCERREILS